MPSTILVAFPRSTTKYLVWCSKVVPRVQNLDYATNINYYWVGLNLTQPYYDSGYPNCPYSRSMWEDFQMLEYYYLIKGCSWIRFNPKLLKDPLKIVDFMIVLNPLELNLIKPEIEFEPAFL